MSSSKDEEDAPCNIAAGDDNEEEEKAAVAVGPQQQQQEVKHQEAGQDHQNKKEDQQNNDNNPDTSSFCPICFRSAANKKKGSADASEDAGELVVQLVCDPTCRHAFCLGCLERLFFAPANYENNDDVPTVRDCPICRTSISYFDLVYCNHKKPVNAPISVVPEELQGCQFRPKKLNNLGPLQACFSFPAATTDTENEKSSTEQCSDAPKLCFQFAGMALNYEQFYHAASHTWQGRTKELLDKGQNYFKAILCFSSDWKFIRRGVVLRVRCTTDDVSNSNNQEKDIVCRIGGASGNVYMRSVDNDDDDGQHQPNQQQQQQQQPPSYHPATISGNVFCQGLKVGLASYHFVLEQQHDTNDNDDEEPAPPPQQQQLRVYISYEHADTAAWPNLDNGAPIPSRVYFKNISFPDPFTFRGHICWLEDYGTPWQGAARWEYEMKFDSEYMCILGGVVHSITADGGRQEMARYGQQLVYCNAALFDEFRRRGRFSPLFTEAELRQQIEDRLVEQGAPSSVVYLVGFLKHEASQIGSDNPVEYL